MAGQDIQKQVSRGYYVIWKDLIQKKALQRERSIKLKKVKNILKV